jgi:DNA-binding transcriptional LysR family regulator
MDRFDAMKVFVVAVDEGSLAAAGRKLGRSPAAISRAIAFLEDRAGTTLLYRTTRSIKLSEEGERYVASCWRVLAELERPPVVVVAAGVDARSSNSRSAPADRATEYRF